MTFNIQNWFICRYISNFIVYANRTNIENKDSPIMTTVDMTRHTKNKIYRKQIHQEQELTPNYLPASWREVN